MQPSEREAIGRLAGELLEVGSDLIGDLHRGIAARAFGATAAVNAPVRLIHDAVAGGVYGALRIGLGGAATLAGRAAALHPGVGNADGRIGDSPQGSLVLGAINGILGDELAAQDSPLALPMEIRELPRPEQATGRIAVFLHGLCETHESWGRPTGLRFGDRMGAELGLSAVYVRYNSGRRISANGRELAALLGELIDGWPRPVTEIVLIGHSMGGLVARSACHYADPATAAKIRHVFCLGTPHLGADLEKGTNALTHALARLPETAGLAKLLNRRSVGIKDLRFGAVAEEDWHGHDPDEYLRDRCTEVPFLETATYYFIGAQLREGRLGEWLGDLLVRSPSASGRGSGKGRSMPFAVDKGLELTGLHHFDLLTHPAVYDQLRTWLSATPRPAVSALTA